MEDILFYIYAIKFQGVSLTNLTRQVIIHSVLHPLGLAFRVINSAALREPLGDITDGQHSGWHHVMNNSANIIKLMLSGNYKGKNIYIVALLTGCEEP